ncbi:beta-ketoacyl-[acyl-carrier-protein] synthase family protein [Maridesulfovibrio sp.]|uniref:beta-ketoacyl-[acyl-carrier-protein] synthase family protein n=1 Tax=Maridesulfovibrio sp. TaxID=2795000 RepID=UPI002A18B174|nr:beta-ketoacyl-[acyl-carrier-protein] synthase family protein [Maridesulfovibrio sp.]
MDLPVSICATGCVCAAGRDTETCFETMTRGQVTPTFDPPLPLEQEMVSPVFAVDRAWLDSPQTLLTDTMRILLTAAREACAQAGINKGNSGQLRIGTCIGSSTGASLNFKPFYQQWREGESPDLGIIRSYLHSNPALCLAEYLGFTGPAQTVTNACSSGTDAIGIAASWIRQGLCDAVLAGGADALSSISYTGFSRLMITGPEKCRPFDVNRKGLNLGEGAAVLLLTDENGLKKLGRKSLGSILGYGTCCDAHHLTAPHPQGIGLRKAIGEALKRSDLHANQIGFINTHGTGTDNNDRVEGQVMRKMFPGTTITGTKGYTGHTLGAAGAIEAVMTVEALRRGLIMPTSGFRDADQETGIIPLAHPLETDAEFALSDSLAFGGNNSALVFRRAEA